MLNLVKAITEMCQTITSTIKYFRDDHEKMVVSASNYKENEDFVRLQKARADKAELKFRIIKENFEVARAGKELREYYESVSEGTRRSNLGQREC